MQKNRKATRNTPNLKKIFRAKKTQQTMNEYKHKAAYYERKYLEVNHLYDHFKTQFAPGHFYSPYPDLKELKGRKDVFDRSKRPISGIDLREQQQLSLLRELATYYDDLPYNSAKSAHLRYFYGMHAYSYTDAIILFCILRHYQPRRVIEIGSGYSSALMLDTNEIFFSNKMKLTFIEPYPDLLFSLTESKDREKYRLLDRPLHKVKPDVFKELKAGDILFIDSTHVSKAGSDVNQIFFDILPVLNKGVLIHIHDIFYPFEYPKDWVLETRAWNEDYLLRAFLYNNDSYEVVMFNHFMNLYHAPKLKKLMPLTQKNAGGSIWIRKVK